MKRVFRVSKKGKVKPIVLSTLQAPENLDAKLALIVRLRLTNVQALIPVGLLAVAEALKREVIALAGKRYSRTGGLPGIVRWSQQRGFIYLSDQKVAVTCRRLRDRAQNREVPLQTYQGLQQPHEADGKLLLQILRGLSCRSYGECADVREPQSNEAIPAAFGLSSSSVSRRFIRASARKLRELCERRLESYDFVALFLDGKTFAEDEMIIVRLRLTNVALGITLSGEKVILGFIQAGTENERVCSDFLQTLLERGLRVDPSLLCILDGAKGLPKAIQKVFGSQAAIQRCQWHKRENVVSYLPKSQQALWRRKLQGVYEKPTYAEARAALLRCRQELRLINVSAVASLEEGMEETLTLHRLGLFSTLGVSLKTTNCLESLMAQIGQRTGKVDRWRNSDQKQRWVASALLDIEPRLRRIQGYRHLPLLRIALRREMEGKEAAAANAVA